MQSFYETFSSAEKAEYTQLHAALGTAKSKTTRRIARQAVERFEARHRARLSAAATRRAAITPIGVIVKARPRPSGVPMFIGT